MWWQIQWLEDLKWEPQSPSCFRRWKVAMSRRMWASSRSWRQGKEFSLRTSWCYWHLAFSPMKPAWDFSRTLRQKKQKTKLCIFKILNLGCFITAAIQIFSLHLHSSVRWVLNIAILQMNRLRFIWPKCEQMAWLQNQLSVTLPLGGGFTPSLHKRENWGSEMCPHCPRSHAHWWQNPAVPHDSSADQCFTSVNVPTSLPVSLGDTGSDTGDLGWDPGSCTSNPLQGEVDTAGPGIARL